MMNNFWALKIMVEGGHIFEICGAEDVLRGALEEWSSGEYEGGKLTVNGVFDSADCAEHIVVVKREEIIGMSLLKRYT